MRQATLIVLAVFWGFLLVIAGNTKGGEIPNFLTTFEVRSSRDEPMLSILCFPLTLENFRAFMEYAGKTWTDELEMGITLQLLRTEALWPGRNVFYVFVRAERPIIFFPAMFQFTQGDDQYNITADETLPWWEKDAPFSGGLFQPGTSTQGFIALPSGIDTEDPFKIHYGTSWGTIHPFAGKMLQRETTTLDQLMLGVRQRTTQALTANRWQMVRLEEEKVIDLMPVDIDTYSDKYVVWGDSERNWPGYILPDGRLLLTLLPPGESVVIWMSGTLSEDGKRIQFDLSDTVQWEYVTGFSEPLPEKVSTVSVYLEAIGSKE